MRNWKVQKFWNKRESKSVWLHWWSLVDLKKLKDDIEKEIHQKEERGDYASIDTKLRPN